jgi:hypothetical protein
MSLVEGFDNPSSMIANVDPGSFLITVKMSRAVLALLVIIALYFCMYATGHYFLAAWLGLNILAWPFIAGAYIASRA